MDFQASAFRHRKDAALIVWKQPGLLSLMGFFCTNLFFMGFKQIEHPAWGAEREESVALSFFEQLDSAQPDLHRI